MIFSNRELQLPAADLRQVVADAVPPLGHGQGRARLRRRRQAGDAAGHLPRGDEGDGRDGEGRRGAEGHVVRRRRSTASDPEKYARSFPVNSLRDVGSDGRLDSKTTSVDICSCRSVGIGLALARSGGRASRLVPDLPSPLRTWEESKLYVLRAVRRSAARWIRASCCSRTTA